jgi:hypothetical protein
MPRRCGVWGSVAQWVIFEPPAEPAPIEGLTCVKCQGQNGRHEIRLCPHQHRRPDDRATARRVEGREVRSRLRGQCGGIGFLHVERMLVGEEFIEDHAERINIGSCGKAAGITLRQGSRGTFEQLQIGGNAHAGMIVCEQSDPLVRQCMSTAAWKTA